MTRVVDIIRHIQNVGPLDPGLLVGRETRGPESYRQGLRPDTLDLYRIWEPKP